MRYDLLIHCAASLEFDAPEADLHRVNVDGTRHALAFARATGAQFLHVSTAYVCGQSEGPIREGKLHGDIRFANGYEASKARGEREVEISGVPFAIVRPSITLGESDTGAASARVSTSILQRELRDGRAVISRRDAADGESPVGDQRDVVESALIVGQESVQHRERSLVGAHYHDPRVDRGSRRV